MSDKSTTRRAGIAILLDDLSLGRSSLAITQCHKMGWLRTHARPDSVVRNDSLGRRRGSAVAET